MTDQQRRDVQERQTHYNDGVTAAQDAILHALRWSRFRRMPWQAIRDLIREVARGVKIEATKP